MGQLEIHARPHCIIIIETEPSLTPDTPPVLHSTMIRTALEAETLARCLAVVFGDGVTGQR